jgi:hypothetical protein
MKQRPTLPDPTVTPTPRPGPWWQVRMMWLVVGGPLVVVVAALLTAVLAVRGADPVVSRASAVPALKARNHAATGGVAPIATGQDAR